MRVSATPGSAAARRGRASDGWPFCDGDVAPGLDLNTIIEYTHRVLAGRGRILIARLFVLAWRRQRRHAARARRVAARSSSSPRPRSAGYGRGGPQGGAVAAHLGFAMLLIGLLLYLWRAPSAGAARPTTGGPRLRGLAIAATWRVLVHDRGGRLHGRHANYGRADYQLGDGAHHACGKEFPTCNGEFMPFGERAPRGHPPHTPRVHVHRFDPGYRAGRGGAAKAAWRSATPTRLRPCSGSDPGGRAQRLAGGIRAG